MAILLMILAGVLAALSNLCMRASIDVKGTARAFFVFQLFFSFLVVLFLYPIFSSEFVWNWETFQFAVFAGLLLGLMKEMIGKALKEGPAGLTFAIVNSSTIMPAILITLFLTDYIESIFTQWNLIGSLLVVGGLFWASYNSEQDKKNRVLWIVCTLFAFTLHILFLLVTDLCITLMKSELNFTIWFAPITFISASAIHAVRFAQLEKRWPIGSEVFWGILGGILNGTCMYFFLKATEQATPQEQAVIFPVFAVSLVFACNLWGQKIYREKINWYANGLACAGIVVGTVDWANLSLGY